MARRKRSSDVLETARRRLAGLKSITPAPDFTGDLNLDIFEQDISNFDSNLDEYNQILSSIDQRLNDVEAEESRLNDKNKRVLAAVAAKYGTDSNEYEAVGGTRDSERKAPGRKPTGNS